MTPPGSDISPSLEAVPVPENEREFKLVVFSLAGAEFGLAIERVREIIRVVEITRMPKSPRFLSGIINLLILSWPELLELP